MINGNDTMMDDYGKPSSDELGDALAAGDEAHSNEPVEASSDRRIAELEEKLLRAKADYANVQRWAREQKSEAIRFGNAELLTSLLPIVDDFERCMETKADSPGAEALLAGVKLVHQNLVKLFAVHDVGVVGKVGETFDPDRHEAVLRREATDAAPESVLHVVVKGYRLGDRVLRPAKVVVAAPPRQEPVEPKGK